MDPASAATTAAAKQREGELFIREVWGLTGTAIVFVILRYYARLKAVGIKGLTADDYLMFPATVIMSIESMAGYMVVAWWKGFANNGISDLDRATLVQKSILDPNGPAAEEVRLRIGGSKNHVLGLVMYTTLMWLLKGCWALYYNRLTDGVRNRRLLIKGTIFVLPATYIGCLLVAFLKCMPFDHHWQIFPNPGVNCMPAISPLQTIFVMVMNTVTDFYLMAIPIPMIWKSKLPLKKKLMIILMFSGAILEMVFGILRAVAILKDGDTNPAESGYWSIRESFVSFVLTNLPMVYPLFREYFNKLRGKTGSIATGKSTGNSYQLGSYPPRSRNRNNNSTGDTRSRGPNIIPNETITSDSKENITCVDTLEDPVTRGCTVGGDNSLTDILQGETETGAPSCCRRCHRDLEVGQRNYQPSFGVSNSQSMPFDLREQRESSSNQITITTEYMVTDSGKNRALPGSAYAF
ncbi:hypothetical protein PG990_005067 [Apiospora arundinis]|uniref:Rhodopsin domain-containing protein n=1 Tax=Apiospora arundinis TaxID=335852 RepID=A0ABR2J7P1_9PEZI